MSYFKIKLKILLIKVNKNNNKSIILFRKTIAPLKPIRFTIGTHKFRGTPFGKNWCASNPAGNFPYPWGSRNT